MTVKKMRARRTTEQIIAEVEAKPFLAGVGALDSACASLGTHLIEMSVRVPTPRGARCSTRSVA